MNIPKLSYYFLFTFSMSLQRKYTFDGSLKNYALLFFLEGVVRIQHFIYKRLIAFNEFSVDFKTLSIVLFFYYSSSASHFARWVMYKDNFIWHWVIPWYKRSQLYCFWPIFVSPTHYWLSANMQKVLRPPLLKFSTFCC